MFKSKPIPINAEAIKALQIYPLRPVRKADPKIA
jgi:hypothetical protein